MTKLRRGRPKTRPHDAQPVHVWLPRDLYDQLKRRSTETGVPMNTMIERWITIALQNGA